MPLDGCHPLQLSTTQKRAFAHDVSLLNIELFSATDATSLV
jgi:hypothetical protein